MWQFIISLAVVLSLFTLSEAKERRVEVIFKVNLKAPENSKEVGLWIPYPVSDENQTIEDVRISGNYSYQGIYKEKEFGNSILYAEWKKPQKDRTLTYIFKVRRKEVVKKEFPKIEPPFNEKEFEKYLTATSLSPTTGKVKEIAENITKGKKTILDKARAIYDWIVDNMYLIPK